MMTLKELNKIVQKPDYKKTGNWMARNITREMAIPFTWLFLHTPVTANGVTFISLIVGLAGCAFFAFGTPIAIFCGSLLLQLWYLLDHVDGQIARYRKQESVTGVFFDYIGHHLIHLSVFIGLGWGVYMYTGEIIYILFGMAAGAGVLLLNLIQDCKYKAFFCWVEKKYIWREPLSPEQPAASLSVASQANSLPKAMFSWMHKLCEIHVIMNVLTVLSILQFFVDIYLWKDVLILYFVMVPLVAVIRAAYFILKGKPDSEFKTFVQTK